MFMFWTKNNRLKPEYNWLKLPELFRNQRNLLYQFYQELFTRLQQYHHLNFITQLHQADVWKQLHDSQFWNYQHHKLFGLPYLVKDNFVVADHLTEAGSKILQGFIPNFSAQVVQLLTKQGLVLIGKTNMDELGLGGTGLESYLGPVMNPNDLARITGGSSSGSAVAVALNLVPFSLGSDTGNSVRLPASFMGIFGFKPTFGAISRFGLIPYSPSLDTVSIFAISLPLMRILMRILAVLDPKDFAMQKIPVLPAPDLTTLKIGVIGLHKPITRERTIQTFRHTLLDRLQNRQFHVQILELDLELTALLNFLYQVLSFPDALSSQANLTGFNFGYAGAQKSPEKFDFETTITANRTAGFGLEIKKRYTVGQFFVDEQNRDTIYQKALQMIAFLKQSWQRQFADFDFLMHPASSDIAPLHREIQKNRLDPQPVPHLVDDYLLITNFLGWPSLVVPCLKIGNNCIGINIFSRAQTDFALLHFGQMISEICTEEATLEN